MTVFVSLPHVRHAHVRMEPVNFTCPQVTQTQTEAGHTPHLVDVHDLLYNALYKTHRRKTLIYTHLKHAQNIHYGSKG